MTEKENKVLEIANNTLYFNDSSDYESALWEILSILKPEIFENDNYLDLKYIGEN